MEMHNRLARVSYRNAHKDHTVQLLAVVFVVFVHSPHSISRRERLSCGVQTPKRSAVQSGPAQRILCRHGFNDFPGHAARWPLRGARSLCGFALRIWSSSTWHLNCTCVACLSTVLASLPRASAQCGHGSGTVSAAFAHTETRKRRLHLPCVTQLWDGSWRLSQPVVWASRLERRGSSVPSHGTRAGKNIYSYSTRCIIQYPAHSDVTRDPPPVSGAEPYRTRQGHRQGDTYRKFVYLSACSRYGWERGQPSQLT